MNREIFPGGAYPLSGDVQSTPGSPSVSVVGIHGIPVNSASFVGGEVLEYNPNANAWVPTIRACIQVNNVTVSDDYTIAVNLPKLARINGS